MNHGGRRPGAGRPKGAKNKKKQGSNVKKETKQPENENLTPLEYLLGVMRDEKASASRRMKAAISAAQYVHPKIDRNKKLDRLERAKRASERFLSRKPPTKVIPFERE